MGKRKSKPAAFMSYVRFNDEHDNGRLTEFCQRLSGEVQVQTGAEFPIFQDRNDIKWGQNWKRRVKESVDAVTFLIPILTPGFFKSSACREELKRFLAREKKLRRDDLILPVYYVDCGVLNDESKRSTDRLAQVLATRQYGDWRVLRFKPWTSLGEPLARLAVQIRDALERTAKPGRPAAKRAAGKKRARTRPPGAELAVQATPAVEAETGAGGAVAKPSAKTQIPTLVVAASGGDYDSITKAIFAANPGYRILVRAGVYRGGLVIDKPLEIIGDGKPGEVVVEASGQNAVLFKTAWGRLVNLTLRQTGGGNWFGVDIAQGRLEMEECDVSSQSLACVAIHGGADPHLRRNRIHDGKQGGVIVYENGQGVLEDNEIFGNAFSGVEITSGGNPTMRRNRIHDGKQAGVFVNRNGQGVLEDNEIFGNAFSGVAVHEGGNPTVRRNRITKNGGYGVQVREGSAATIEDNDLRGNSLGALHIAPGSKPKVKCARNQEVTQAAAVTGV